MAAPEGQWNPVSPAEVARISPWRARLADAG